MCEEDKNLLAAKHLIFYIMRSIADAKYYDEGDGVYNSWANNYEDEISVISMWEAYDDVHIDSLIDMFISKSLHYIDTMDGVVYNLGFLREHLWFIDVISEYYRDKKHKFTDKKPKELNRLELLVENHKEKRDIEQAPEFDLNQIEFPVDLQKSINGEIHNYMTGTPEELQDQESLNEILEMNLHAFRECYPEDYSSYLEKIFLENLSDERKAEKKNEFLRGIAEERCRYFFEDFEDFEELAEDPEEFLSFLQDEVVEDDFLGMYRNICIDSQPKIVWKYISFYLDKFQYLYEKKHGSIGLSREQVLEIERKEIEAEYRQMPAELVYMLEEEYEEGAELRREQEAAWQEMAEYGDSLEKSNDDGWFYGDD